MYDLPQSFASVTLSLISAGSLVSSMVTNAGNGVGGAVSRNRSPALIVRRCEHSTSGSTQNPELSTSIIPSTTIIGTSTIFKLATFVYSISSIGVVLSILPGVT